MYQVRRCLVIMVIVCTLLSNLSRSVIAQSREAQIAEAERLEAQATAAFRTARYDEAIILVNRMVAIYEKAFTPEHPVVATWLNNLAELYRSKGDYAQATTLYKRAIAINEKAFGPKHSQLAVLVNNLGLLYHTIGEYAQAEPLYKRAIAIAEQSSGVEPVNFANFLSNLADLYRAKGNYIQAESLYKRALAMFKKTIRPDHPNKAIILNNLARLYVNKGDYGQAELTLKEALAMLEKALGPKHPEVATLLNNLATLQQEAGNDEQAQSSLKRSLAIQESILGPNHPSLAISLNNLAVLHSKKSDYVQAELLNRRALAILEKALGPKHPDVAAALGNLAVLYRFKGDYQQAEQLLKRVIEILEEVLGPTHPDVAGYLSNLARLSDAKGDYLQAVQFQMQANEIQERNLTLILTVGSENEKQLYLDTLSAASHLTISFHVRSAPQNPQAARSALSTILQRKGRAVDVMADQIGVLRRRASPQDQKLLDLLASTRSQLASLQLSGGGQLPPAALRAKVKHLIAEVERLEGEVSQRSKEFRAQLQPVTLDAVLQAIPVGTALVEIYAYAPYNAKATKEDETWGAPRYVAYVIQRDQAVPQWVELGEVQDIDAEIERLRAALKDPRRTDVQTIAREVDERVMRPIRKLLGETRHLLLSPDGGLNLIPFAALVDEKGKYLVENYSINYLTSGRDLLRLQVQAESRSAPVVIANPLYDLRAMSQPKVAGRKASQAAKLIGSYPRLMKFNSMNFQLKTYKPLPGTAEEAAELAKLLPQGTQILLQTQATEAALKQVNRPRILHIATHGFFFTVHDQIFHVLPAINRMMQVESDPMNAFSLLAQWDNPLLRSGLVLAGVKQQSSGANEDGVLTALETVGLDLWGTKLVVLSACETGLGKATNGGGVYGLRRALVLAGSETQVMSLWKVSDSGTRDLMAAYYKRLQSGEGRTDSLRQVQLAMLRGGVSVGSSDRKRETSETDEKAIPKNYRHPYYWAAFIPSGDWRSMDGK